MRPQHKCQCDRYSSRPALCIHQYMIYKTDSKGCVPTMGKGIYHKGLAAQKSCGTRHAKVLAHQT